MDNKKIILIKGSDAQLYEQAIFIMKSEVPPQKPARLVREAEKIINDYIKNNNLQFSGNEKVTNQVKTKARRRRFRIPEGILYIGIILTCIMLAATIYNLLIV